MRNLTLKLWDMTGITLLNIGVLLVVLIYLFPISYMVVTALKDEAQFADPNAPILPSRAIEGDFEGESYPLYTVPFPEGERELLLVQARRQVSQFADPANPASELIEWEGNWRQLSPCLLYTSPSPRDS